MEEAMESVAASKRNCDLAVPIGKASFFGPSVVWTKRRRYDLLHARAVQVCQLPSPV